MEGHSVRTGVCIHFEKLAEARLVKIADGRFAVGPDPFGMLRAQILVNLLLKLGQSVNRMTDYNRSGHSIRRHKHNFSTIGEVSLFKRGKRKTEMLTAES